MKTISINEKFTFSFISPLSEYEKDLILLRRLNFNPSYEDVTKENCPIIYAEGRKEVLFNIDVKNVEEAAFVKQALKYGKHY